MNRIADLKQLKSNKSYNNNKGKNTLSTASISVSTKLSTKVRLSEIFEYMSNCSSNSKGKISIPSILNLYS